MGMSNYVLQQDDEYAKSIVAFMAKEFGFDAADLTEDQERDLLLQFEDCEDYQMHFRATH